MGRDGNEHMVHVGGWERTTNDDLPTGTSFWHSNPLEVDLGMISNRESAMVNSGTEATMSSSALARAPRARSGHSKTAVSWAVGCAPSETSSGALTHGQPSTVFHQDFVSDNLAAA